MLYSSSWKRQFNKEAVTMRLNDPASRLKISLLVLSLLCTYAAGKTIYVDDDSPSDFSTIQAAIDDANDGSSREETYVYLHNALVDANDSNRFDRKGGLLCLRTVFTIA
jgi:hypothetical protein